MSQHKEQPDATLGNNAWMEAQAKLNGEVKGLAVPIHWKPLGPTIKDSGERQTFSSGSMRDPGTGKIKWSRITFGPMMRRWAQHLTTAEAKYPDPTPGIPNFSLIDTDEELVRYKESAFRHFMSWFFEETDEDHASAVFFNINGVELLKEKWAKFGKPGSLQRTLQSGQDQQGLVNLGGALQNASPIRQS